MEFKNTIVAFEYVNASKQLHSTIRLIPTTPQTWHINTVEEQRTFAMTRAESKVSFSYVDQISVVENTETEIKTRICEICEDKVPAKWFCVDCTQSLCEKCKSHHLKSKASANCNVVAIGTQKKADIHGDECSCIYHPSETYRQFCRSCNEIVCSKCVICEHRKHEIINFDEALCEKKTRFQRKVDRIRKEHLPEIRHRIIFIRKNQEEYSLSVKNSIHEVYKRHEIWKRKAEEIRDKVLHDLRMSEKEDTETLIRTEHSLQEMSDEIEQILVRLEREVDAKSDESLFSFFDMAEKKLDRFEMPKKKITLAPPSFVTTTFCPSLMTRQFGVLEPQKREIKPKPKSARPKSPVPCRKSKVVNKRSVSIVYTLQVPGTIFSVCPVGNGTAWIGTGFRDKSVRQGALFLVDVDGNTTMTLKTGYNPLSLALTKSGNILFCSGLRCRLINFDDSGKITIFNDKATHTQGVATTKEYNVLISCMNDGKIIRMSEGGSVVETLENDSRGQKMVDSPLKLQENINGDICVLNGSGPEKCSNPKGKELICLSGGKVKFKYHGNTATQALMKPTFSDITCDKRRNILISDFYNDCVHLLDKTGKFLKYIGTKDDGIVNPEGIAIDSSGNVMLCSQNNLMYIENYMH